MLRLTPEEMRLLGYRVIDMLVDHFESVQDKPVTRNLRAVELEGLLREKMPELGTPPEKVLEELQTKVFNAIMHPDHPRFFAFIPSPSNYVSVMADAIAAGFNVFAGTWLEASGPAEIELTTIDWLKTACGLPEQAGGLFVSGGSVANMTGLAVARHIHPAGRSSSAVIYCSDQTHSSVQRALNIIGYQNTQIRKLRSDLEFKLDLHQLAECVQKDLADRKQPFCIVASAGTTNTGAIDPLPELATFCRQQNLWLHVDGAFGAAAVLSDTGKKLLDGIQFADSLSMDPHKWLFQPFEIGCVLVKHRRWLKETFHILPEYLKDVAGTDEEINFCDYGIQLTRYFRALKLWMSLKVFGRKAFADAIESGFSRAQYAASLVSQMPSWELITGPQMAIVTFRYAPPQLSLQELNLLNQRIAQQMLADGYALVLTTEIKGIVVLRFCLINPRTTEDDIQQTLTRLDQFAKIDR